MRNFGPFIPQTLTGEQLELLVVLLMVLEGKEVVARVVLVRDFEVVVLTAVAPRQGGRVKKDAIGP